MNLNFLYAILSGFTISFVIYSYIQGEFNWSLWVAMLIGGTIGYLFMTCFNKKTNKNSRFYRK